MDAFWTHLESIGPGSLLVGVVIMILTGRLVPGSERDYWRKAFFAEQEKTTKLAVSAEVQRDFLTSLSGVIRGEVDTRGEVDET